ncbi:hypothetical protein GBAR_LOCUS8380 [Geodia barretti]|nr:hypothetical protein GBAR_LOCUS8380 [Geodia barretti]
MTLSLETSDQQKMTAHFSKPQKDPLSAYVELVGKVGPDLSLQVERAVSFGSEFDLDAYNEVVQLSAQLPAIFPSSSY